MTEIDIVTPPPLDESQLSPFEDATELLSDPEGLRARAQRDGYLFFRGLLDPEPILELRRAVLGVLDRHGLRAEGAQELSGKLDVERLRRIPAAELREDIGVTAQMYTELQQLPELHRLPHHPTLLNVYRVLFGSEVFVHPRHIMRAMTPHPAISATPPHQDFPLVQGTTETWTCWFPVGACPTSRGSLAVLRSSHLAGCLPISPGYGAGGITAQLCERENDWVGGDFAVGDVLTFSSLTVHRALPAQVRDEIRVSMDVRYQRAFDMIEEKSLGNHADRPWDEIYQGWTAENADLMYYWDPERLHFSPWDDSLIQPGSRRIC